MAENEKNIFETLGQYRVKVEKNGETVVNVPGLLCLPALLAAPRASIAGIVAAPILGYSIRLENEGGSGDAEEAIRKAANTVRDATASTVKSIREEIDKAWQAMSAEDEAEDAAEEAAKDAEEAAPDEPDDPTNEKTVEDLEKAMDGNNGVPVIHVDRSDTAEL